MTRGAPTRSVSACGCDTRYRSACRRSAVGHRTDAAHLPPSRHFEASHLQFVLCTFWGTLAERRFRRSALTPRRPSAASFGAASSAPNEQGRSGRAFGALRASSPSDLGLTDPSIGSGQGRLMMSTTSPENRVICVQLRLAEVRHPSARPQGKIEGWPPSRQPTSATSIRICW